MSANNHQQVPVIDRKAAAAVLLAAQDDTRPVLHGVHVRDGYAEAADGYALIRVQLPKHRDAPKLGARGASPCSPEGSLFIPFARAKELSRKGKNGSLSWFTERPDGINLAGRDANGSLVLTPLEDRGTLPDFTQVFPADKPIATVALGIDLLRKTLDAMDRAGASEFQTIHLTLFGGQKPVRLSGRDGENRTIDALIMPMVIGGDDAEDGDGNE